MDFFSNVPGPSLPNYCSSLELSDEHSPESTLDNTIVHLRMRLVLQRLCGSHIAGIVLGGVTSFALVGGIIFLRSYLEAPSIIDRV